MNKTVVLNVVGLTKRLIGEHTPFIRSFLEKVIQPQLHQSCLQSPVLLKQLILQVNGQQNTVLLVMDGILRMNVR